MEEIKFLKITEEKLEDVNRWPIWECDVSCFNWEYTEDEICYILEGKVIVKTEDGKSVEVKKGDFVKFPKGLRCRWDIKEKIRKYYKIG